MCEKEAQKCHFPYATHCARERDPGSIKGSLRGMTIREEGGKRQGGRESGEVLGSAIVCLPFIVSAADKKKLLVFLKAQETDVKGESAEERGEEAASAAKELSDISNLTETSHLRHSCKTTRKQD